MQRLPSPPGFPDLDKLHPLLKQINDVASTTTPASTAYVTTAALSCLGACIGPAPAVKEVLGVVTCSVSAFLIGDSTVSFKSSALYTARDLTVGPIQATLDNAFRDAENKYKADMKAWEAQNKGKKDKPLSDPPEEPVEQHLMFPDDCTDAAMIQVLANQSHLGSVMIIDELESLFKSMRGEHNASTRAHLTKIHNHGRIAQGRKGSSSDKKVAVRKCERPFLNILGGSNPDWFQDVAGDNDIKGGWLARYLIVSQPIPADYLPPHDRPEPDYIGQDQIKKICRKVFLNYVDKTEPEEWVISEEAWTLHNKLHVKMWERVNRTTDNQQEARAVAGRMLNNCNRIALILEIFTQYNNEKKTCRIERESMQFAVRLIWFYFNHFLSLTNSTLSNSAEERARARVLATINNSDGGFATQREIGLAIRSIIARKKIKTSVLLQDMLNDGLIVKINPEEVGHVKQCHVYAIPTEDDFLLNPPKREPAQEPVDDDPIDPAVLERAIRNNAATAAKPAEEVKPTRRNFLSINRVEQAEAY